MSAKESSTVRLGVIGLGNMGRRHALNIVEGLTTGLTLAAVADTDPARLEPFKDAAKFTDSLELINSGKVDAVLIATPHYDHTTLGIAALEAGLHVLVEKPISVHKADCERLIAAHKNPKQVFAAMFNQRPDPRYQKLKALIDSGELGRINRINWIITDWFRSEQYYKSGGWRATWAGEGGGVLLNQCPHQLDLWQWLFGMPKTVRAFCQIGRFHNIEVEDSVTAYMEYEEGATGVFITTTGEAPGTNRLEIAAERGRVIIEGDNLRWKRNVVETSEHSRVSKASFLRPELWEVLIETSGVGPQHLGVLQNFADVILKGEKLVAPAAEGINSVELANAMLLSSHEGATITLPMDAAQYETLLKKRIESSTFVKEVAEPGVAADFASSGSRV